jgi:hypothetical protein
MTEPLLARLAALPKKDLPELKILWGEYFGCEPPAYRKGFMVRRLAHRIQELAYGGITKQHRKRLDGLVAGQTDPARKTRMYEDHFVAGTRLIREWQGTDHEVTVVEDGFSYRGRPYRSLSAIARSITGTRWNGPLFFGLRSTQGQKQT